MNIFVKKMEMSTEANKGKGNEWSWEITGGGWRVWSIKTKEGSKKYWSTIWRQFDQNIHASTHCKAVKSQRATTTESLACLFALAKISTDLSSEITKAIRRACGLSNSYDSLTRRTDANVRVGTDRLCAVDFHSNKFIKTLFLEFYKVLRFTYP